MHVSLLWVVLLAAPWLQTSENAGIEMTIRHTFSGNSSDQNFYLLGDRKRVESRNGQGRRRRDGSTQWISGPRLALITRCDLGQIFELNLDAGEYESAAYPPKPWSKDEIEALGLSLPAVSPSGAPTLSD
jgi:hypothetical protein